MKRYEKTEVPLYEVDADGAAADVVADVSIEWTGDAIVVEVSRVDESATGDVRVIVR